METSEREKRRHLLYYLKVINMGTDEVIGYLVDITSKGLMIMGNDQVAVNKLYNLKIIPDTELAEKDEITIKANCLWCRKSVNMEYWDSGFNLVDFDRNDVSDIEMLINQLALKD